MRQPIRQLDPTIVNRIAAGEVIERPAAVVKELGENSLDAGATTIDVEVEAGGKRAIIIRDDGYGIPEAELPLAVASHATSKLAVSSDLMHIGSFGFRGEAIASIASVADVTIKSRTADAATGAEIAVRFGDIGTVAPVGTAPGTEIAVRELFRQTPARFKFLKGDSAELSHIVEAIQRLALPRPDVAFRIQHDGRRVMEAAPVDDPRDRVADFWGPGCAEAMRAVHYAEEGLTIDGFVAVPSYTRPNSTRIQIFVNGRFVKDRSLIAAVRDAYREYLPSGRYPAAILFLTMPVEGYDVNVHPQKLEVRFREPRRLFARIKTAVRERLMQGVAPPRIDLAAYVRDRQSSEGFDVPPTAREAAATRRASEPRMPAYNGRFREDDSDDASLQPAGTGHETGADGGAGIGSMLLARVMAQPPADGPTGPAPRLSASPSGQPEDGFAAAAMMLAGATHTATKSRERGGWSSPASVAGGLDSSSINRLLDTYPYRGKPTAAKPASQGAGAETLTPALQRGNYTAGLRTLYQVAQRYLLLEYEDRLALVDQHALHERVMFASFDAKLRHTATERQRLLLPEPLDLTRQERALLEDEGVRETLGRLGFTVENSKPTGDDEEGDPALTAIPLLLGRRMKTPQVKSVVEGTLQALAGGDEEAIQRLLGGSDTQATDDQPDAGRVPDVARRVVATLACKAAVKAGEHLAPEEALALLVEAERIESSYACPHGRPTTISFTFRQLDDLFGRS